MAIKIGLEDLPPLLGAGIRFAARGRRAARAGAADGARRAPTRGWPGCFATAALHAVAYGPIYCGRAVHDPVLGLAAVLFVGDAARQRTCARSLMHRRRAAAGAAAAGHGGRGSAALSRRSGRRSSIGEGRFALAAALACAAAPLASAIGNVAIKRSGGALDAVVLNGWAMLGGGALLLAVSGLAETWEVSWSARAVGSIAYLAVIGSAVPFVTLTILLRELPAVTVSYISR